MRETPRQRHLRVKYGITEAQFNELAGRYGGACWICKKVPKGRLQVDHNHKTGEIRGLLCWFDNKALSYQWTAERLSAAYKYIKPLGAPDYGPDYTGLFVPKRKRKRRKSR